MTIEELRSRGERLNEELGRESYRAGAGLVAETDFAGIFARYTDLAGSEAWDAAQASRPLLEWVADIRIGRSVAELDDRLHAWEATAVVTLDGERIPYQSVGILIANESRRGRRLALDGARRAVVGDPAALRAERLVRERDLLTAALGLPYVEARERLSGIDLDALASQCETYVAGTEAMYREVLAEHLRDELGIAPAEAERSDGAFLFRGAAYDEYFPGADLVSAARRQVGEMGLDAVAGGRIVLDVEERERKRPRAFCAPVRVPDEVYLVIRPHGGYPDYRAFWHELGHALHFANADRTLAFEHRWLGDNSVTEGYAMLFEHQLIQPAWLRRYARLGGESLRAFLRRQAFALLAVTRRYAAKLGYELALHRAPSLEAGAAAYAERLTIATGFRYAPEDALLDLDDGFYAARYLRAWQYEATLRQVLTDRFDEDWFRNPRAGPFVLDLLARGQRENAAQLAAELTGHALDFAPLARAIESALR